MNKNLKYLIKVVKKASRLITNNLIVDSKDENNDLITNFDLKIETFISKKLLKNILILKLLAKNLVRIKIKLPIISQLTQLMEQLILQMDYHFLVFKLQWLKILKHALQFFIFRN